MPSIARLQRTSHAADSATETPSKTRRDFFRRRRDQQISFPESIRGRDSTESPCRRFLLRACFLADLHPQSLANKEQRPAIWESKNFTKRSRPQRGGSQHWLFQKEIHAVEVDDTMTVVQCIHPQDPSDSGAALQQREIGQCGNTKFRWRHFEAANLKVIDLSCTNFMRRAASKMRRHSRRFQRNPSRFKESFVENCNKCAGIDEQTSGLPLNRTPYS